MNGKAEEEQEGIQEFILCSSSCGDISIGKVVSCFCGLWECEIKPKEISSCHCVFEDLLLLWFNHAAGSHF